MARHRTLPTHQATEATDQSAANQVQIAYHTPGKKDATNNTCVPKTHATERATPGAYNTWRKYAPKSRHAGRRGNHT